MQCTRHKQTLYKLPRKRSGFLNHFGISGKGSQRVLFRSSTLCSLLFKTSWPRRFFSNMKRLSRTLATHRREEEEETMFFVSYTGIHSFVHTHKLAQLSAQTFARIFPRSTTRNNINLFFAPSLHKAPLPPPWTLEFCRNRILPKPYKKKKNLPILHSHLHHRNHDWANLHTLYTCTKDKTESSL